MYRSAGEAPTLQIDLRAIVENWRTLLGQAVGATRCAAVVKANAYGLGATTVASVLVAAGCRDFFVALVDEALSLRPSLPASARLFVLHGALPGAETECALAGVIPVLNSTDQIARWRTLASQLGRRLPAALQVDTGMARLGLPLDQALALRPNDLEGVDLQLWMSHLVAAEEVDNPNNDVQRERFSSVVRRWPDVPASLANSSGIFLGTPWHFNLLRLGAALYGVAPTVGRANQMLPVVRLQAPLIQWREVRTGEGVGYNHAWVAERPTIVGTVSAGYADGYLRSLSDRAHLSFRGQRVPLIGRVSMDTITVDVTRLPINVLTPGAMFDLIDAEHDINALAAEAGTNAYEILTSLGTRYRRQYTSS